MKSDFTMDSRARLSAALMKARQSSIALAASAALNSPRVDKLNDAEIAAWQAVDMAVEAHVAALAEERDRLAGALEKIANIERGWNKPHRLDTARGLLDDCVAVARDAAAKSEKSDG